MKKGKNNTWNYVFALTAFALAGLLAFYPRSDESDDSLNENDFSKTSTTLEEENKLAKKATNTELIKKQIIDKSENEDKKILTVESDDINYDKNLETKSVSEFEFEDINSLDKEEIFVNKIVVSKNVDTDEESVTYREFIKDEYQTITTTVPGVIKNINYYPSFFVWTSVNTENVNLKNEDDQIEPINLSLVISSDGQELKKVDYDVTSVTPRWRQWAEIDLSLLEQETVEGTWEVQIINNKNKEVLESRNFKLITPEINQQEETAEFKKTF